MTSLSSLLTRAIHRSLFRYAIGQHVWWSEHPQYRFEVVEQRYTVRSVMSPLHEYYLWPVGQTPNHLKGWGYEADILPLEDRPHLVTVKQEEHA